MRSQRSLPWNIKPTLTVALGLVAAGGLATYLTPAGAQPAATERTAVTAQAPSPVETLVVASTQTREEHLFHGIVEPRRRAILAFAAGGRLDSRRARVGDRVERHELVARIDGRGYRNEVRAARANAEEVDLRSEQLARDRARAQELREAGVTTNSQLEQVTSGAGRAAVMQSAARARLDEARRRAGETALRAPFAGVVTDVFVEPAEMVSPGQPVMRIVGLEGYEVVLQVNAELAGLVPPETEIALNVSGLESTDPLARRALTGRVRATVTDATGLEGLFPIVVDIDPDPALRGGLGVTATLVGPARSGVRVPLNAILDPSGRRPFVWSVVDGRAERAWIRIGRLSDGLVELTDGLEPGAVIVVAGHTRLLPGDRVEAGR